MLSEAFNSPSTSLTSLNSFTNLNCEDLASEGSATSLGRTSTDDELTSRSADNLLPSRKLKKQPMSDSSLGIAMKSRVRKSPPKDTMSGERGGGTAGETATESRTRSYTAAGSESRTSRTRRDSVPGLEDGAESKRKTSKDSDKKRNSMPDVEAQMAKSSAAGGSESRTGRTRKDSVPGLGDGAESKRKTSKDGDKKRNSMPDVEAQMDASVAAVKKKTMSPRRSSESNIVVSPRRNPSESSLRESKVAGKVANVSGTASERTVGNQKRLLAESKRPSDTSLLSSDANTPVGRLRSATTGHISRVSGRPSSAAATSGDRPKKKPTNKPAPVARPISAQPSQAVLRRMAEQKKQEEERERQEREREEREREERAAKKQGSYTDGEAAVAGVLEGQAERGNREGLTLKDSVTGTPSVNGTTPKHKKSLPVSKSTLELVRLVS